jgi:FixJ family two-component response regulator
MRHRKRKKATALEGRLGCDGQISSVEDHGMHASIFMVDDDAVVREALVHLVNAFGWSGTGFAAAQECIAAVKRQPPACIITDLNMPVMNGAAMIENLRADGVRIPIIAITAVGDDSQLVRRARAAGITDVVSKPVVNHELKRILSQLLAPDWTSWKLT